MLRDRRRHAEPDRPRHRPQRDRLGPYAARGGRRLRGAAEAQLTGRLTACAGSCGPGSLHFINGLYEANRNRAPVILIATQIVRQDLGFESIQEIDFEDVFKGCSVYCEMIVTPEQARRKTVAACQAALTKRGVAVLVVPADIANADVARRTALRRSCAAPAHSPERCGPRRDRGHSQQEARRSRSTPAPAAPARMTRWSPRRRG